MYHRIFFKASIEIKETQFFIPFKKKIRLIFWDFSCIGNCWDRSAGVHHCHFVLNLYITLTLCVSFSSIRSGELVVMHLFSICLSRKTSCWMKSSGNKYICSRESTDVNRKLMTAEFLLTAAVSESCYCQACLIATL